MEKHFDGFSVKYILRAKNSEPVKLAKVVPQNIETSLDFFFQVSNQPSIQVLEDQNPTINIIIVKIGEQHSLPTPTTLTNK